MKWGLVFLCWTFLAVFYTSEGGLRVTYQKLPFPWLRVFRDELVFFYFWLSFTPVIIRLDRRMREGRWGWLRRLPVHLSAGVFFSSLHPTALALVFHALGWGATYPSLAAR